MKRRTLIIIACLLVFVATILTANLQSNGFEYAPGGSIWSSNGSPKFTDFYESGSYIYCSQRIDGGWNIGCRTNIFANCYSITEGGTLLTVYPLGGVIPPGTDFIGVLTTIQQ